MCVLVIMHVNDEVNELVGCWPLANSQPHAREANEIPVVSSEIQQESIHFILLWGILTSLAVVSISDTGELFSAERDYPKSRSGCHQGGTRLLTAASPPYPSESSEAEVTVPDILGRITLVMLKNTTKEVKMVQIKMKLIDSY